MRYIKTYESYERFEERDLTNVNYYNTIKNDFNISPDELGYIILDFIDEYELKYKCVVEDVMYNRFYPTKEIDIHFYSISGGRHNIKYWMERKIGHGHVFDWNILSEINGRLSEYGLTIKRDNIYQIFLNDYELKIRISKMDKAIPNSIKSSLWSKIKDLDK